MATPVDVGNWRAGSPRAKIGRAMPTSAARPKSKSTHVRRTGINAVLATIRGNPRTTIPGFCSVVGWTGSGCNPDLLAGAHRLDRAKGGNLPMARLSSVPHLDPATILI